MYATKITDYGYKKRVSVYANEIETQKNISKGTERKKYMEMSEKEKKHSDKRRERYYKKAVYDLIELAVMNEFECMVTLTFKEKITDYDIALQEWKKFLKRLRHKVNDLKYICVWEYQKERGNVFHFHCLFNFLMEHEQLTKIWGNGFIWISKLKTRSDNLQQIRYMTKYLVKEMIANQENQKRGIRFFFTSNNLIKPTIQTLQEKIDLDTIIFENMENIISDGSYYLKDYNNNMINRCDYVEFQK